MSLVKLITSDQFDPLIGVGAEIMGKHDLSKSASTIFGMDYSDLKPDKNHVGIHLVALGDSDHYLINRNGDGFPKEACVKYHNTFVKHGHVFRHHRNKDPEKSIGIIKASAYNPDVARIELFIHADREKAAPELERLEKEGEIPFSMACRVPYDRCTICGALRKHAGDSSECDHVKNDLGRTYEDGRVVGTYNDEPDFFDISFVGKPADRIAWDLKRIDGDEKTAEFGDSIFKELDSVKLAEFEGVVAPDDVDIDTESGIRKLGYAKQLASLHNKYRGWFSKEASVITVRDKYLYTMRKIASCALDDDTIKQLREYSTGTVFKALGDNGIVMDVPTFFKYATGDNYYEIDPYIGQISKRVPDVIDNAVKTASCSRLCSSTEFDANPDHGLARMRRTGLMNKLSSAGMFSTDRIIESNCNDKLFTLDINSEKRLNNSIANKLAEKYATYELSAIDAVLQRHDGDNKSGNSGIDTVAVMAAQHIK